MFINSFKGKFMLDKNDKCFNVTNNLNIKKGHSYYYINKLQNFAKYLAKSFSKENHPKRFSSVQKFVFVLIMISSLQYLGKNIFF